jgi:hypothetical protein
MKGGIAAECHVVKDLSEIVCYDKELLVETYTPRYEIGCEVW